jgi:hypothetical protein
MPDGTFQLPPLDANMPKYVATKPFAITEADWPTVYRQRTEEHMTLDVLASLWGVTVLTIRRTLQRYEATNG